MLNQGMPYDLKVLIKSSMVITYCSVAYPSSKQHELNLRLKP